MNRKRPEDLRSHRWLGVNDMRSFGHRSRLKQFGFDTEDWSGKPVIGIINTWSEINACHAHLRARAEDVKRGILQAGGFPVELPAMSLAEPFVKPSTMLYRNFLAMEAEELLRCHPIDGAVLLGGCDKTTPGLDHGRDQHGRAGDLRAGRADAARQLARAVSRLRLGCLEILDGEAGRQHHRRAVGGDGGRHLPLVRHLHGDGNRRHHDGDHRGARPDAAGRVLDPGRRFRRIRACAPRPAGASSTWCGRISRLDRILTPAAFDNAIKVHMALGGSTNAIIHVVAMARRAGLKLDMQRFDEISRDIPVIANIRPSGKYLMEDFFYAGGLRALMTALKDRLDLSCLTVTGRSIGENIADAEIYLPDVIHTLADPLYGEGATAVLTGNLAPRGCVMKPAAAEKRFLKHRGKAIAFEDYNHMAREVERDDLDVTPDHVLVLKNAGPKGGPGMPEWGMLPIPKKLVKAGVRDMVRISDGRMSGTSYGACILHVAPESYVGGPLAFVQTGDEIEVDVAARSIHLAISRGGVQSPPRRLAGAAAALRTRLRRDVLAAYRAGRRGLRFRFPGRHRTDAGAGNPLTNGDVRAAWRQLDRAGAFC